MPGVLIIEALAQAGGLLSLRTVESQGENRDAIYLFAAVDKVRFKRMVSPGDQLQLEVEYIKHRNDVWKFKGRATVGGQVVCTAEITTAGKERD